MVLTMGLSGYLSSHFEARWLDPYTQHTIGFLVLAVALPFLGPTPHFHLPTSLPLFIGSVAAFYLGVGLVGPTQSVLCLRILSQSGLSQQEVASALAAGTPARRCAILCPWPVYPRAMCRELPDTESSAPPSPVTATCRGRSQRHPLDAREPLWTSRSWGTCATGPRLPRCHLRAGCFHRSRLRARALRAQPLQARAAAQALRRVHHVLLLPQLVPVPMLQVLPEEGGCGQGPVLGGGSRRGGRFVQKGQVESIRLQFHFPTVEPRRAKEKHPLREG